MKLLLRKPILTKVMLTSKEQLIPRSCFIYQKLIPGSKCFALLSKKTKLPKKSKFIPNAKPVAKQSLYQNKILATQTKLCSATGTAFVQTCLLQSKKKVSGEISKEPFLDVLLTDLEQSSFSLTFKDKVLKNQGLLRKKLPLPDLRTSSYLFSETELPLTNKSFISSQTFSQKETGLKSWHLFNTTSKSCLIKPFFIVLLSKSGIKSNIKSENLNLIFISTLSKQINYLHCVKTHVPSHSAGNKFQQFQVVRDRNTAGITPQKQLKKNVSSNMVTNGNLSKRNNQISCLLKVGDYVHCGDKIGYFYETPIIITESGKILRVSKTQITIQKMQPVLFYSQAEIHVENNEWVKRSTPILTLTHQTLVTGDIVQGIPRIEQLFEASTAAPPGAALQDFSSPSDDDSLKRSSIVDYLRSRHSSHLLPPTSSFMGARNESVFESSSKSTPLALLTKQENDQINDNSGEKRYNCVSKQDFDTYSTLDLATENKPMSLYKTLQSQVRETFRKKWDQLPLPVAVRQSLEEIQQIIVESIQKVYISQGVLIADKHIEIIVRQMTSKAQVFDGGSTGLLIDEILSLQQIENANISTPGRKALYLPVIMGLTRSALSSDSFVSAASFQETTRVLSRDAVAGKTDFLRGLKEKVIIGDLIDAGTGLDVFYIYSLFSKKIFQDKFRDILNRKLTHKTLKKLVLTIFKPQ